MKNLKNLWAALAARCAPTSDQITALALPPSETGGPNAAYAPKASRRVGPEMLANPIGEHERMISGMVGRVELTEFPLLALLTIDNYPKGYPVGSRRPNWTRVELPPTDLEGPLTIEYVWRAVERHDLRRLWPSTLTLAQLEWRDVLLMLDPDGLVGRLRDARLEIAVVEEIYGARAELFSDGRYLHDVWGPCHWSALVRGIMVAEHWTHKPIVPLRPSLPPELIERLRRTYEAKSVMVDELGDQNLPVCPEYI